jgi:hypothetical protein
MEKLDHKKVLKSLYYPSEKEIATVDVPAMNFVMIDGFGDPNTSQEFQDAVEALYGVSYALKFMLKKREGVPDYAVMPLEGLWRADDMRRFTPEAKELWKWTLMIMQPDFITEDDFRIARENLGRKKNPVGLPKVRFERFHDGLCAQILHVGPFSEEGSTVARLHAFIEETGRKLAGDHHEIYMSDFRKTAPEKLKTVIRQPMR